ncbi:MAG TPA: TolC family protein, partial [Candidatus Wallbacteria bacterium]|nr:TolC family protein [Candidatus Wallbacteria bacterium]
EEGDKMSLPKFNNTILPATLQEALKKQTENHPVLLAAATNIDEKFFEYDRERSEYKPTLYFESSRDFRKNYSGVTGDANSVRALVKMRWNIYDGGARDASTDKMSSLVNREKQIFDRVRRSLLNDLQLTWTGYKLLDSQIGALKKSLMFTRKSLKSYKEEFMLGQRLLINILDAENEYQTMRSQLASIEFELLATKYRLLYSMGNISEDLGLEIPLAKEYKALNKMKPAFKDVLPPDNDLDKDGVKDNMDLSVNSRASSEVDVMGELAGMTKKYAQEPLNNAVVEDSSVIKNKQELQANKLKLDVATRLDLVSFIKGSIELTDSSKKIMREMIEQVRRMANEGIIKVTVDTAEAGKADENYKLAIQRAHNIKKIFAFHNIEPEAIQIFGSASEKGTTENTVILKIETHPEAMKENYETVSLDEIRFENKKEDFKSGVKEALGVLASQIKQKGNPPVEVIVYSNDFDDESENEAISKKRAEKICAELVASGANSGRVVPVGWGNYDASLDLFQGTGEAAINNKTDFIIRSVR